MEQSNNIRYLKGVGEKRAELLAKLNIFTVDDLLHYYPRSYIDKSSPKLIKDITDGEQCGVLATVIKQFAPRYINKNMVIYKFTASDINGDYLKITIFNNRFAAQKLSDGGTFLFYGKFTKMLDKCEINSPSIENVDEGLKVQAVYPLSEGISNTIMQKLVCSALELVPESINDTLPEKIRTENGLCHIRYALQNIHRPKDMEALEIARKRLAFEELLYMSLGILMIKMRNKGENKCAVTQNFNNEFWALMPFKPTNAQARAAQEIICDMGGTNPMSRLLQGDVGSGKTAVAACACFNAVKNGLQCAVMAPTEILAEQHYNSFCNILKHSNMNVALLCGSLTAKQKNDIYNRLKNGEIDILIGTHALIAEKVEFLRLGLVITDEQHRFGVRQRAALFSKGDNPHILVMSATPIPRTLALIVYGDLEISVLNELPPGRKHIDTYAVDSGKRTRALNYLKKHIDEGRQGYIVCPLVEQSDNDDMMSAVEYFNKLSKTELKGYKLGLLHGKMKAAEKEAIMSDFSKGKIQILVATTVIEVGVDVPNAVIMIIENAERFGLSQLHQLRGRVGRGEHKSTCILITNAKNETAVKRMEIMCRTNDGFVISNEDLALRGPGDFLGERQHGLPKLKIADFAENMDVLHATQKIAKEILNDDATLIKTENRGIKAAVGKLFVNIEGSIC